MKISAIQNKIITPLKSAQTDVIKHNLKPDTFEKTTQNNIISLNKSGKNLHVSFTGNLQSPLKDTGIQFKVSGVTKHQKGLKGAHANATDDNLVKLANSDWKDGRALNYEIQTHPIYNTKSIALVDPEFGEIGGIPAPIGEKFLTLLEGEEKNNFKFELTNITGGTQASFPIIAAKANFKYTGENQETKNAVQQTLDDLVNSSDKAISSSVSMYQPNFSPKEVLMKMFDVEGARKGLGEVRQIKDAVDNICKEFNDPENKNILIVGHCSPDGDTVGSVIAMGAALKGAFPDKNIETSIDDKIPGMFKNVSGYDDIKRPYNQKNVDNIKESIKKLEIKNDTTAQAQVKMLKKELEDATNPDKLIDPESMKTGKAKKYDLIVMIDTPTAGRSSKAYKEYFENSKKNIFIDHHPHRQSEWTKAKSTLGLDMDKIHENKLALIAESVPAATQIVTAVAEKAGLLGKMFKNSAENAKKFVAGIAAGTMTDTANYKNSSNFDPSEKNLPKTKQANYYPEGMTQWLINELETQSGGGVDKKWMREKITFEIPNQPLVRPNGTIGIGPRDKVVGYALKGREMYPEIGLGIQKINYNQMNDVLFNAQKQDSTITMNDVYNEFKNCEVISALKNSSKFAPKPDPNDKSFSAIASQTYESQFDDQRIAVFMAENEKQGYLNKFNEIADKSTISFSFRSAAGTNDAQLLATLFGGGGHGAAAGGNLSMKDLTFDTKLKVKINDKIVDDAKSIYDATSKNVKNPSANKIQIVKSQDETGRTCSELIQAVTEQIRANKNVVPFRR